jgi:hypothetical protein
MHAPGLRRYRKSLPPDPFRAADLLFERQDLLIEQLRCLGETSHRQRLKAELAKIRGELERLGVSWR